MAKTYNDLMARSRRVGSNLKEICEAAGVNYQSVSNWKRFEPKSIRMFRALDETLQKMERERLGA